MKVEKVTIGKGTTSCETKDGPWIRRFYQIEALLEAGDNRQQVRALLEQEIDQWLAEPDVSKVPDLDLAQINAFPWCKYEKQPQGAWIFTDERRPVGSEKFIEAVKAAGGTLELGEYKYNIPKDASAKPFLSRWPAKKKE